MPNRFDVPAAVADLAQTSSAEGGNRTHTPRREPDFESGASTNSATSALVHRRRLIPRSSSRLKTGLAREILASQHLSAEMETGLEEAE